MHHVTAVEDQLTGPSTRPATASAQLDLATRHLHGVSTLLAQRDDLRGVYAFADVVEESVRWSA